MNINHPPRRAMIAVDSCARFRLLACCLTVLILACASLAAGQKGAAKRPQKLPSPDKIVSDYQKAVGGKKRLAAIRDATYEWTIQVSGQPIGTALTQQRAPASTHTEMRFANGTVESAANASSAWARGLDGTFRTLTGAEAGAARLAALLGASRMVDYKKLNVLARTVAFDESLTEPAYVVEFSMRNGTRSRYWFGASSHLLLKVENEALKTRESFSDYRAEGEIIEPHTMELDLNGTGALKLSLQHASYNTNLSAAVFDPPGSVDALDVATILREIDRNQEQVDERVGDYTFKQKETEREINGRGEVTKETVKVYEVFPVPGHAPVFKLISENGVPLSPERAAKEEKKVAEALETAYRERDKEKEKKERKAAERERKGQPRKEESDDDITISDFLRVSELVSPRRERLGDRDTVVFDFRPRAGYRPKNRAEEIVSKLVGIVWVDPVDKQIMRLEARLAEGYKIGGGLVLSLKQGAAFVMEQARMADGVWLPRFAQVNLSYKVLLFGGGDVNTTVEWSDYKRFNTDVRDYKIETPVDKPKPENPQPSKPMS